MKRLRTQRLVLREATEHDAAFVAELMNDEGYLTLIGDRGVRTSEDAHRYLETSVLYDYGGHGRGFNVVENEEGVPVGICGLIKREELDDVDLGYAILGAYVGRGYATEAASATLEHALGDLGLKRVVAITTILNAGSRKVLERIGMGLERTYHSDTGETCLYALAVRDATTVGLSDQAGAQATPEKA